MKQFDRLVLLIGTNPLPNFVVAEHFLNTMQLKKVYLIYSEKTRFYDGTFHEAERLEDVIRARHPKKRDLLPFQKIAISDISTAKVIRQEVEDKLIEKLPPGCKIHLNYTGGTKAMGIHIYNILKEAKEISEKSFSYLDARTYQIVDDDEGITTKDLRDNISISFDEMIRLHGLNRANEDKDTSEFKETLSYFKQIIKNNALDDYFRYYNRPLFENKKGGLVEKTNDLKEETKKTRISGELLEVFKTLPEKWRFFNDNGEYVEPEDKNIKSPLMYLDGIWLEDYVYEALKALKEGCPNLNFYKNWEIKKPEWKNDSKFEIDVIALRGYQLIGISCTTSTGTELCKKKGFEILLRTRQIGGDEAKAVLITRLPSKTVDIIQDSLRADTAGGDNILVLGKEDLKREGLLEKFSDFIR